tara:strand:+ start:283 stop:549 length:267 start_codon:yes stop_codon:yes gene_type:complete
MGKQKLTAEGAATKKARDEAYAKGAAWNGKDTSIFKRKEKKRNNQRDGQCSTSDIHHINGSLTNTKRVSIANNRNVWKNGDRKKKKTT